MNPLGLAEKDGEVAHVFDQSREEMPSGVHFSISNRNVFASSMVAALKRSSLPWTVLAHEAYNGMDSTAASPAQAPPSAGRGPGRCRATMRSSVARFLLCSRRVETSSGDRVDRLASEMPAFEGVRQLLSRWIGEGMEFSRAGSWAPPGGLECCSTWISAARRSASQALALLLQSTVKSDARRSSPLAARIS